MFSLDNVLMTVGPRRASPRAKETVKKAYFMRKSFNTSVDRHSHLKGALIRPNRCWNYSISVAVSPVHDFESNP